MLVCYICGTPVVNGFVCGYPPAPDSQKIALCPEHDTEKNRKTVSRVWEETQKEEFFIESRIQAQQKQLTVYNLHIVFKNGGLAKYTCYSCTPTPQATLRIQEVSGLLTYLPMADIRSYSLMPAMADSFDKN